MLKKAFPEIETTRYLREHFRCQKCRKIGEYQNKEKMKKETIFCDECFNKNVSVKGCDFKIKFRIDVNDNNNFGKIRYKRTTMSMVKKALEMIDSEKERVICRIGQLEETLTQICEIYRYVITRGWSIFSVYFYNYY